MPNPLPHATRNDLDKKTRAKIVELLSDRLADAQDLSSQLRQAHWNVKGPHFIGLHELFDKILHDLDPLIDDLAERAIQLGGALRATLRASAKRSALKEYPLDIFSCADHVSAVSDALAAFGALARRAIDAADKAGDADTADLFTDVSRFIDKSLWLVEAHPQSKS